VKQPRACPATPFSLRILPAFIRPHIALVLFFFLACSAQSASAQEIIKNYVVSNSIPIRTVEPDSSDYSDLEKIGEAIGNARVVMLGEQDHGDAPTFLAKTRLIKYLHVRKGFNVLAFESDFYALNAGWDRLDKTTPLIDSFLRWNIFPIWTYCNTCSQLFYQYIPSTYAPRATASKDAPLIISGFDPQMALSFSAKNLTHNLDSVMRSLDFPITHQADYLTAVLPSFDSIRLAWLPRHKKDDISKYGKYLHQIREEAASRLDPHSFWMQIIGNLQDEIDEYIENRKEYRSSRNTRDRRMATNLRWLLDYKFPGEKLIVWAANAHVAKYADSTGSNFEKKIIAMGKFFTDDSVIRDQTYILGFTSYRGEAGRLGFKTFTVRNPVSNGFENWIDPHFAYSFVDFKTYNRQNPGKTEEFYMKGLGHQSRFKKDWTQIFDGVFFIRDMYPCKR
jgi:erythromycin esterase-like protein